MRNFTHRNKVVEFYDISGEVLDNSIRSESNVWSTGGNGFMNQHGGYITPTRIHSSTVNMQDIWLKTSDGEKCVQLGDSEIPVRSGQNISVICAGHRPTNKWLYAMIVNHSARDTRKVTSAREINRVLELEVLGTSSLCKGLALLVATFVLGSINWILGSAALFTLIYLAWRKHVTASELNDAVFEHIDDLARNLINVHRQNGTEPHVQNLP